MMVSRKDSVARCCVSGSCMAQKLSDEILFTGLAIIERLQIKPIPPHPRLRLECLFIWLSEKQKLTKSGWTLFSRWMFRDSYDVRSILNELIIIECGIHITSTIP